MHIIIICQRGGDRPKITKIFPPNICQQQISQWKWERDNQWVKRNGRGPLGPRPFLFTHWLSLPHFPCNICCWQILEANILVILDLSPPLWQISTNIYCAVFLGAQICTSAKICTRMSTPRPNKINGVQPLICKISGPNRELLRQLF